MTRAEIEELAKQQIPNRMGIGREIRELEEVLHSEEQVVRMARASREGKNGVFVLTNRRVLWFHASVTRRDVIEQPYERINSVEASRKMMSATLSINAGGDVWAMKDIMPKDAVNDLAGMIRERADQAHHHAPAPAAAAAETPDVIGQIQRLGELRDAGILTVEEFEAKKAELLAKL